MPSLELKPPFRLQKLTPGTKTVFLAGSIEMGKVRPGVAIAYSRAGLEYGSVDTGEHRVISFSNQHAASAYLRKHLL